jgi:chitinase
MDKVAAVSDFVNLMTYDFRVAGAGGLAGHHANLYPHPADPRQRSADGAVREFLAAGVPASKLVLGVPFYGRAWVVAGTGEPSLYQPAMAPAERLETKYGSLATALVDRDGFARRWDAAAQAPYLWNAGKRVFVSYEDPESLRLKARYIVEKGLAGAMFWEYGADPTGALLDVLDAGLRRAPAARQR